MDKRRELREARHARVRKRVFGSPGRPRLNVFRSLRHIYAQIIDDSNGRTLASASTLDAELREAVDGSGKLGAAQAVGQLVATRAIQKGIKRVVFDRAGYKYHGRVKALADAAREAGLEF